MIMVSRIYRWGGHTDLVNGDTVSRHLVRQLFGDVSACPLHGFAWPIRWGNAGRKP